MKRIWIYLLGLIPLAFVYDDLKAALNSWAFLGAVLAYVVALRLVSGKYGK